MENNMKIDKITFSVVSLSDQTNDKHYWFKKEPIERLKHMEILRRINYGYSAASRLQRVFEVIER